MWLPMKKKYLQNRNVVHVKKTPDKKSDSRKERFIVKNGSDTVLQTETTCCVGIQKNGEQKSSQRYTEGIRGTRTEDGQMILKINHILMLRMQCLCLCDKEHQKLIFQNFLGGV
jgi:hypothetical protein